jgi:hypothetical protein
MQLLPAKSFIQLVVALVVSYLIKYQAQVGECLSQMRMAEEAQTGQPLKSVEMESKGLMLRMVDKMEQVVGLVKELVEEVVLVPKESERSGRQLGEKVECVLEGIMEEREFFRRERFQAEQMGKEAKSYKGRSNHNNVNSKGLGSREWVEFS